MSNQVHPSIVGGAIELDGRAGGVPMAEIRRVAIAFEAMFKLPPIVRVLGRFERGSFELAPDGDPNVEVWDLREISGRQFCRVISTTQRHLYVQVPRGLNNGRALALDPGRGTHVRVRFVL